MAYAFCIFMALLPSFVLIQYFVKSDKFPEPMGTVWMVFRKGIASVFWVLLVVLPASILFLDEWVASSNIVVGSGITAFAMAAIPEEFFKYRVLRKYVAGHKDFDEPMDGIVYGAVASLGFATIENVLYCSSGDLSVAFMRAFTAVPGHASFGAIMGYTFARRHFAGKANGVFGPALLLPILLHGVYDWVLFVGDGVATSAVDRDLYPEELQLIGACALIFFIVGGYMFWKVRRIVRIMRIEQEAM